VFNETYLNHVKIQQTSSSRRFHRMDR